MIKFKNREIPGPHTSLVAMPPNFQSRESTFFGLRGVSQIVGLQTDREIMCHIWLTHRSWTRPNPQQLFDFLSDLDTKVSEHGTLEEESVRGVGLDRKFHYCTFLGFFPLPLEGQAQPQPIVDIAQTLIDYPSNATQGAWFIFGRLVWQQLAAGS